MYVRKPQKNGQIWLITLSKVNPGFAAIITKNFEKKKRKKKKMVVMYLHGIETELQTFHSLV